MHTPAAALAWEFWRKHRKGLIIVVGLFMTFALVYPKLCAQAGFNPGSPDDLDQLARKMMPVSDDGKVSQPQIFRLLYLIFLAGGPLWAMFLTLILVAWMFTLAEFDPKTKKPVLFPARMFTLPVSTSFLFWWLWLTGMAAIAAINGSWVYFVRLPHMVMYGAYQNCFGWMTLLALVQAIFWALAAWPITRVVVLITVLSGFQGAALQPAVFESPFFLPPLFIIGTVLARVGLQKMRHGQWQGSTWKLPTLAARAELRGPKRFTSPAQAQLWFEWRRFARTLCFVVTAMVVVPLVILLVRVGAGLGPLRNASMSGFAMYLIAGPLGVIFALVTPAISGDLPFLLNRPLINGGIMTAILKAAAISVLFSWTVVWLALSAMPLLGDFAWVEQTLSYPRILTTLGLLLLSWRLLSVNLCFAWSKNRWLPFFMVAAGVAMLFLFHENRVWRLLPGLLSVLVAVKFLLAFLTFRVSIKRGLIASSTVIDYLFVWLLFVGALIALAFIQFRYQEWIISAVLGIILLAPLASIGFCPIMLARSRHE